MVLVAPPAQISFLNIFLRPVGTLDGERCVESLTPYVLRAYLAVWYKDRGTHTQHFPEAIFSGINKTLMKFIKLIEVTKCEFPGHELCLTSTP